MSFIFNILVGGKGSRVKTITKGKAKSELKIYQNKSILEFQINSIRKQGFKNIICIHSNKKYKSINSYKKKNIKILEENKQLGTAGTLYTLKKMKSKFFIIIFGDILFNFDFKRLISYHKFKNSDCTIVSHPNSHPKDSDCLKIDKHSRVLTFKSKPKVFYNNLCASGILVLNKNIINLLDRKKSDISKNLIPKILKIKKKIYAYHTREYLKDIGTVERFKEAKKDILTNKFKFGNFKNKIPAVFLDRDGVINKDNYNNNYQNPKKIFSHVPKAIKKINDNGFLVILVTNQPAVAKGFISIEKLKKDFLFLEKFLSKKNAYIDKIYFCPCHPKKGFEGEVQKYKRKCSWRKPNNGMLIDAIKLFNINVKKSFMVGDRLTDYYCAKKTKIKFIQIGNFFQYKGVLKKNNLLEAVNYIFKS